MVKLRWNMIENLKDCYRDLEKKGIIFNFDSC